MTLDQAVAAFEDAYTVDAGIPATDVVDVCSGGIRLKGGNLPALYAESKDAVIEFSEALSRAMWRGDRFRWIEKPTLQKYQMTRTDERGTHRLVEDRYAVESRIVFSE